MPLRESRFIMETLTQLQTQSLFGGGEPWGALPALVVLGLMLIIAVYMELKERRIPNWLTFSGIGAGLAIGLLRGGEAMWSSGGGLAIGFGFLFVFYLFGGVGGGDVKLMGASGALLGTSLILPAMMYTAVLGALLGVMMVIWRKDFWARIAWGMGRLAFWRPGEEAGPPPSSPVTVPYGLAIAVGCLLALLVRGVL